MVVVAVDRSGVVRWGGEEFDLRSAVDGGGLVFADRLLRVADERANGGVVRFSTLGSGRGRWAVVTYVVGAGRQGGASAMVWSSIDAVPDATGAGAWYEGVPEIGEVTIDEFGRVTLGGRSSG